MQIIKLSATDSTNAYIKKLMVSKPLDDFTVVVAKEQSKGRGQMGTVWESESGKNLTFSILKKFKNLDAKDQFRLNICVSLAIVTTLNALHVPDLRIKWPNDILSGKSKICGILTENILAGNQIQASVIGIGLNVNQSAFNNLINVSSLKLLLGRIVNLDELLESLLSNLRHTFLYVESKFSEDLWREYERLLFRKDKPSTFKSTDNEVFMGFIRGVSKDGKLLVLVEDDIVKTFNMKEIKLMY